MKLNQLTDQELFAMLQERRVNADRLMRKGGGLEYGWDWPTFVVLYPEEAAELTAIRLECQKRMADKDKNITFEATVMPWFNTRMKS